MAALCQYMLMAVISEYTSRKPSDSPKEREPVRKSMAMAMNPTMMPTKPRNNGNVEPKPIDASPTRM
jgi:hypothetical protein